MSILPFPTAAQAPRASEDRVSIVEALLADNERALVSYATRLLSGDRERARDVVQDVFLRLCAQEELSGLGREWLFRVTRNRCVDVHRKESRMATVETMDDSLWHGGAAGEPDPEAGEGLGDAEELAQAIDRLPTRQQEALRLKFESGLSYAEIGRVMETSAGNVGWILHKAIQGLRARMIPEGGAR